MWVLKRLILTTDILWGNNLICRNKEIKEIKNNIYKEGGVNIMNKIAVRNNYVINRNSRILEVKWIINSWRYVYHINISILKDSRY